MASNTLRFFQRPAYLLLVIGLVALGLRLIGLGEKPLWYDEVLTLKRATLPLGELVADSFRNKHFPTYFLLARPFASDAWDPWMLRLPSAVFGSIGVVLAARIAFEIGGAWAALATGLAMALSPMDVQYGQEARSYTLTSATILLSMWGLVRLAALRGDASAATEGSRTSTGAWLAYAGGMILALYSLGVAIAWFAAANLAVLVLLLIGQAGDRLRGGRWIAINLVVVALWLPGIMRLVFANQSSPTRGLEWIPEPTRELVWQVVAGLYTFRVSDMMTLELYPEALPLFGIAVAGLALLGAWTLRRNRGVGVILLTATVVVPVAVLIASEVKSFFLPRYLLWTTGTYFVLIGIGVTALPRLLRWIGIALIVLGGTASLSVYYPAETKSRWDLAAAHIAANAQPDSSVITSSGLGRFMLESYLSRIAPGMRDTVRFRELPEIRERMAAGGALWLIHGRAGQGTMISRKAFVAPWRGSGSVGAPVRLGKHVSVWKVGGREQP